MAQRLAYLEAIVGADVTAFRRGMRDIRNEVGFLSETVSGISGAGRALTFMFTTPLVAMGTAAVNVASDFQASMYNINAIAGLTGQELDALSQRALEFGANTRSGAQAAADALYTVFSAGLTDPEQAFKAMEVATYTAEAGLADLTVTTEAMLAVMLSYGDTGEEMAWRVSNAMTQMVAVGVGSMQDFSGALGSVVPTAQGLGMSVEELMGDMAFLTQRGLSAARAGTALNSALTALIKPTDAMSAAMTSLGAGSSQELIDKFGGVNGALKALIEHAGGSQEALAAMFGNIRGLRAINLFAGDVDMWNASMEEFNGALDGATMRAWDSQMMSFSATWDKLKASVMGAAVVIGTQFFPLLQPIVSAMTALFMRVVTMDKGVLGMAVGFTTFAAALPPVIWLLTSLISPFGVVIGLIAGFGVAVSSNFLGVGDIVKEASDGIVFGVRAINTVMNGFWLALAPKNIDPFQNIDFSVMDEQSVEPMTFGGGGAAQSLWDIYEDSGMLETMSWNEFVEAATEGGWEGGVVDAAFTIDTGEGMSDAALQMQADYDTIAQSLEGTAPAVQIPFLDRFSEAITVWTPKVMGVLGALGNRFLTWFDGIGGNILSAMVEGIGSIDTALIYEGVQAVLTGDWSWIADQFGLGGEEINTALAGWKTTIEAAIPQVSAGLRTLIDSAGTFIKDEGVPLLARSFGFLAGRIGVLLNNAVQAGIAYFTGGGAGDTASAIGDYVDESIVTPFDEGMQDATAGTQLATDIWNTLGSDIGAGLVSSVNGIDTGLVTAAFSVKLGEIGAWIGDTGLAKLSEGIGYMTGKVAILIGEGMSMAMGAVADFFTGSEADTSGAVTFGEDVATPFVTGFATALAEGDVTSPLDGFMTSLAGGLALVATVDMFLPVVSAITRSMRAGFRMTKWLLTGNVVSRGIKDAIVARVAAQGGWMAAITAIKTSISTSAASASFTATASSIGSGLMSALVAFISSPITIGIVIGTLAYLVLPESFRQGVRDKVEEAFNWALADMTGMTWDDVMVTVNSAAIDFVSGGDDQLESDDNEGAYYIDWSAPEGMTEEEAWGVVPTGEMTLVPSNILIDPLAGYTMATTGDEDVALEVPVSPVLEMTDTQAMFASEILAGADFQTIINEQLIPLETYWNTMFGAEGTMATAFSEFSTGVVIGWTDADLAANTFLTTLDEGLPIAQANLTTFSDVLTTSMNLVALTLLEATNAASSLVDKIVELTALDTTMNVSVSVSSDGVDGSNKDGLANVPYDGYISELHKGERVLTAQENKRYNEDSDVRVPQNALRGNSGNGGGDTYQTNQITITGVSDFDSFVKEAKRRGIKLG